VSGNEVPIGKIALTLHPGRSESEELQALLVCCPEGQRRSLKEIRIK